MKLNKLMKTKTFWTGVAGIAGGIFLCIQKDYEKGVGAIIAGLSVVFMRDAVSK